MFRVRVSWNSEKLVIPVGSDLLSTGAVTDLLSLASTRFRQHSNSFDPENNFIQLLTDDGFAFAPTDSLQSVLKNDDSLRVLDSKTWIDSQLKVLNGSSWCYISGTDLETETTHWAQIGWSSHFKKMFCSVGKEYRSTNKLALFSFDDLQSFPKSAFVADVSGDDWFAQVKFVVEKGIVVAAELHVKASTDTRAFVKQVPLNYVGKSVKPGDVIVLQSPFSAPSKVYALPPNSSDGPSIEVFLAPSDEPTGATNPPENYSSGSCPIELKQLDAKPFAEQYWPGNDGYQNIFVEFLATNKSAAGVKVIQFTSEYFQNNEWTPADFTSWGYKQSPFYYSTGNAADDILDMGAGEVMKLALRCQVKLSGPALETRVRRIYSTLPKPLKIRFSFTDSDRRTSMIVVTAENPPPQLRSKSTWEKEKGCTALVWNQCDDTVIEDRLILAGHLNVDEQRLELENKLASRTLYVTADSVRSLAYTAAKNGKSELELEDVSFERDGFVAKAYLLVDLAEKNGYAIKTFLKTTTSTSTSFALLPALAKK